MSNEAMTDTQFEHFRRWCECGVELIRYGVDGSGQRSEFSIAVVYEHPNRTCPLRRQAEAADRLYDALRLEL